MLVVYDPASHKLFCARDPLGDRTLYYAVADEAILIASEEQALLAAGVPATINEAAVAAFFAHDMPAWEETYFADIREIRPAHSYTFTPGRISRQRYWAPDLERQIRYRDEAAYAEHFRDELACAVRVRLRTAGAAGAFLSGGLDSSAVVALAAKAGAGLSTYSWLFDTLPQCDERAFIEPIVARHDLDHHPFLADQLTPVCDLDRVNANQPLDNLHYRLKESVYRLARQQGNQVLLTGIYGDQLYRARRFWLYDLFRERRWRETARSLRTLADRHGWRATMNQAEVRYLGKRLLARAGYTRQPVAAGHPPWLSAYSRAYLEGDASLPPADGRQDRWRHLLERHAASEPRARYRPAHYQIELRHPYRDRRLCELMMALPAHHLYRHNQYKHVARVALRGVLPADVLRADRHGTLEALALKGLQEQWPRLRTYLLAHPEWQRFVEPGWLWSTFPARFEHAEDGGELLVPWYCFTFTRWQNETKKITVGKRNNNHDGREYEKQIHKTAKIH